MMLAGFRLDIDLSRETNDKIHLMHILTSSLMFENIRFTEKNDEKHHVILPLDALKRSGINVENITNELLGGERKLFFSFFFSLNIAKLTIPPNKEYKFQMSLIN